MINSFLYRQCYWHEQAKYLHQFIECVWDVSCPEYKKTKNQKLDYNDDVIVKVDTTQLLKHDEMNVFCEDCR